LHTRDINPNSKDFVVFNQNVLKQDINESLARLCDMFYELQNNEGQNHTIAIAEPEIKTHKTAIYECSDCLTLYDEVYGDDINNVASGTKFDTIENYKCPTCDAPKQKFLLIDR
jgi:rubredoxin